ncbi:hypothetical protein [Tenacibaculum amylolyticum]|uniref:hypothetical protein n=1 Tax=Tenacibaculum amylolyticum TaxID=104269 RepID=UPI003894D222
MIKDQLIYGKSFCAVEHSYTNEGKEVYYCLQLKKQKKELQVASSDQFDDFEALTAHLKSIGQQHVVLIVNNNQVLSKEVTGVNDNLNAFQNAFPTLSATNFYSHTHSTSEKLFIAIVRKEIIDNLVNTYAKASIAVVDFSLGNLALGTLSEMLDDTEIYTSNALVVITNQQLTSIKSKQFQLEEYTINGIGISSNYILQLGAIVAFYLQKNVHHDSENLEEFKQKRIFNLGYKVALVIIFFGLLVNFMVFNSYYGKVNSLNQELSIHRDAKNRLKALSVTVQKKKKLLSELENSSAFSVAKYIDQILTDIPKTIVLKEAAYQPVIGNLKKGKEARFSNHQIVVKGVLNNNIDFSNWIDEIERKDWVQKVSELSIAKDRRKTKSNFHIVITIK